MAQKLHSALKKVCEVIYVCVCVSKNAFITYLFNLNIRW